MMRRFDPVFIVFLVLMLMSSLQRYGSIGEWFFHTLMVIPGVIVAIAFHEYAHGLVAYKLGDPTPKFQGRLTVNPKSHIDPVGLIALLFIGFGWGRPVEINPGNFKNRRKGEFMTAIAGVVMNLIIAVIFGFILKFFLMAPFATSGLGEIIQQLLCM